MNVSSYIVRRLGRTSWMFHLVAWSVCIGLLAECCLVGRAEGTLTGPYASVATTMKYMHLSPANRAAAIGLLDAAWTRPEFGETVEKQVRA